MDADRLKDDDSWRMETLFWTGGEEHYRTTLDPDCVMAFPAPAGIVAGPQIIESLKETPRWFAVAMGEKRVSRPSPDLLVLGYHVEARREGATPYKAALHVVLSRRRRSLAAHPASTDPGLMAEPRSARATATDPVVVAGGHRGRHADLLTATLPAQRHDVTPVMSGAVGNPTPNTANVR